MDETYSLNHRRSGAFPTGNDHRIATLLDVLYPLATSDIAEYRSIQ